jgi:N-acetylneuraminic acid mutarotase
VHEISLKFQSESGSAGKKGCEVCDPSTNTWNTTAAVNMPAARDGSAATTLNGTIYVIGGYRSGPLSTVEVYDPSANSWSTGTNMPTARSDLSIAAVNGKRV